MMTSGHILIAAPAAADAERAFLAKSVAAAGYAVTVVEADQAPAAARHSPPAAVVLDVTLLVPDAASALVQAVRMATPRPVLVIVAAQEAEVGPAMLDAGADDFLRRPIMGLELQARLRAHLHPRHEHRSEFSSYSHLPHREVP